MRISPPDNTVPLLELWKDVFGEHDGFWELFLSTGFSPERCRCLYLDGRLAAALCWLDTFSADQKLAYLYAVVTKPEFRGHGLCRTLMAETHRQLAELGYSGAVLVPAQPDLRPMYEKMGYVHCTTVSEFTCEAGSDPLPLRTVTPAEYAALRRKLLPPGGIIQEAENLSFLAAQAELLAGDHVLLAAYREGDVLQCMELLGATDAGPGILHSLGCSRGHFRCPGTGMPFAMFRPLSPDAKAPAYFGLAFD